MAEEISRRDFIKIASIGATAAAVLTGCGPASRYVVREPYTRMPEYNYNGKSTYYATTCRECPAGCGIVVRTMQGRAIKVEGNPNHPVNLGKTCPRGQVSLQGLYNPDRIQNPVQQGSRGGEDFTQLDWEKAVEVVRKALTDNPPEGIAFFMGMAPDHLFDLVTAITKALNAPAPIRFGAHEIFDTRATLVEAARRFFDQPALPFFDIGNSDVVFSFGANFLENYLSPVAYGRGYAKMRQGRSRQHGYLVQFEPVLSQTAANADEWIPLKPGSEALVALALGRAIAEARGGAIPNAFLQVDIATAAKESEVSEETLRRLAGIFKDARNPIAIPGGSALGQSNGLEAAQIVLAINALAGNLGKEGGVFLTPALPVHADIPGAPNTLLDVKDLIDRMQAGQVKVLFVHGANPVFELPKALGFEAALKKVPQVISFSTFPDETAMLSDYIFPDHSGLESWGYQKVATGSDRPVLSGAQPVVAPFYNTRATADVLLGAIQAAGGKLQTALPFKDEVEFIQQSLVELVKEKGFFNAPEIKTFMAQFQQNGGWWAGEAGLQAPDTTDALNRPLNAALAEFDGDGKFYLFPFLSPTLGDGSGANKPWLQELPDPTTTVVWNSWVQINPKTAEELGITDDEVVVISSSAGAVEAVVYKYPAIRPDTIALPFGQGHTAYGRYAKGVGFNPAYLFGLKINGAGDLAYGANKVKIESTGRKRPLARLESRMGVYGEGIRE